MLQNGILENYCTSHFNGYLLFRMKSERLHIFMNCLIKNYAGRVDF